MKAVIPESMDQALGVMIFGIGEDEGATVQFVTEDVSHAIIKADCEALLCGAIYNAQIFDTIADAGVTRYMAAGMTVCDAVLAMNDYQLDMITDYVGGKGCGGMA